MISRFFRLVCVTALLLAAAALTHAENRFSFGVKGGVAVAKQSWSYSDILSFENNFKLGLAGGVIAEYKLAPRIALRGEALLVQKGFKKAIWTLRYSGEPLLESYKYRVDYLALNLLPKAQAPFGTYLLAGPRLDLRLGDGTNLNDPLLDSIETNYSNSIFGLTFGLGHEFRTGTRAVIFLEGQYYLDLGEVASREDFGPDFDGTLESVKNRAFALFAGVRF